MSCTLVQSFYSVNGVNHGSVTSSCCAGALCAAGGAACAWTGAGSRGTRTGAPRRTRSAGAWTATTGACTPGRTRGTGSGCWPPHLALDLDRITVDLDRTAARLVEPLAGPLAEAHARAAVAAAAPAPAPPPPRRVQPASSLKHTAAVKQAVQHRAHSAQLSVRNFTASVPALHACSRSRSRSPTGVPTPTRTDEEMTHDTPVSRDEKCNIY